jgi:D-alanyl-D-alanine carboxypeptidase
MAKRCGLFFAAIISFISFHLVFTCYLLAEEVIRADRFKQEIVTIDSLEFVVSEPWRGKRITAAPLSAPPLVMIPREYAKDGGRLFLLPRVAATFTAMAEAARGDGIMLVIDSSYRSVSYQKTIFKRLMAQEKTFAEIIFSVAPPGYSEHALGLAVDFYPSDWRFAGTEAYKWLLEHGQSFGFRETYPKYGSEHPWEASHWRYIQTDLLISSGTL